MKIIYLYLLPTFIAYLCVRESFSKGGIYSGLKPSISEILLVFTPITNIFYIFMYILVFSNDGKESRLDKIYLKLENDIQENAVRFFNIKK